MWQMDGGILRPTAQTEFDRAGVTASWTGQIVYLEFGYKICIIMINCRTKTTLNRIVAIYLLAALLSGNCDIYYDDDILP